MSAHEMLAEARSLRDPLQRTIMRVLTERGHYDETEDAFDWACWEAYDAAGLIEQFPDRAAEELRCHFLNTGLHGEDESLCLDADVAAILAALGNANDPVCGKGQ